jgi:hypothetical protein
MVVQNFTSGRRFEHHGVGRDLADSGVEKGPNFAVLDAVLDVGFDPVLDVPVDLGFAVNQGYARAMPPKLERRDGRGVLAADDDDIRAEVGMRIVVVVMDLSQVFTRDVEVIGKVVVSGSNGQFASLQNAGAAKALSTDTTRSPAR